MTFINSSTQNQTPSTSSVYAEIGDASASSNEILLTPKMKRGAFVVLEGVDRCGKTTQCSLLLKHMVQTLSLSAIAYRFPDRTTPIGQMINAYLQNQSEMNDQAIHLLFSANRWEASKSLIQQLACGTTVVCDRYAYSGVAFSSAKVKPKINKNQQPKDVNDLSSVLSSEDDNEDSLLSLNWCQSADIGLPAPDAIIFLDLTQAEAEKRGGFGEERYEKRDMQIRVRKRFAELQAMDESDTTSGTPWYVIDAAQSVEEVQSDIEKVVHTTISQVNSGAPLRKLWMEGAHCMLPDASTCNS